MPAPGQQRCRSSTKPEKERSRCLYPFSVFLLAREPLCMLLKAAEAENIDHRIKPRLLVARPQRGMQRAGGKDHAVLGLVDQFDALGRPGEDDAVLADHGAAAQCGE